MAEVRLLIKEVAEMKGIINPFMLSQKSDLNYAICYKIWHGKQQRIDLKTIATLCESLEVLPGDLFEYENKKSSSTT